MLAAIKDVVQRKIGDIQTMLPKNQIGTNDQKVTFDVIRVWADHVRMGYYNE